MPSTQTLPIEVACRLTRWALTPESVLQTTNSSWVLAVRRGSEPAILKVARTTDELVGYRLMSWWDGRGAANVLASDDRALLLERALGVRSLSRMARTGEDDEATAILCDAAASLHARRTKPIPGLHPLDQWFQPLFDLATSNPALAPSALIARGLLREPREIRPLHGDLHHDNVLDFGDRGWLAIDPHGLVGERGFDFANIFVNPDLSDPAYPVATTPGRLDKRLRVVTQAAGMDPTRMLKWIIAWTGLSAAWFIGDDDPQGAAIDLLVNAQATQLLSS